MSGKTGPRILGAVVVVAIAAIVWWWYSQQPALVAPAEAPAEPLAPAAEAEAAAEAEPAAPPPEAPVEYPLPEPEAAEALEPAGIPGALADWLGRKDADAFLQTGDFARRFVATVDNLGRSYAPASLWPVNPTGDRFTVQAQGGETVIAPENAARYAPLVRLAESVDVPRAVDLYIRMYPLLQRAYEDLGYPEARFNNRLIQVIDLLLASPEPEAPVAVKLVEVKGPEVSLRPWVRYEFVDPALESLAAGQKIMVRVGATNERRLKAQLRALRGELLARGAPVASR